MPLQVMPQQEWFLQDQSRPEQQARPIYPAASPMVRSDYLSLGKFCLSLLPEPRFRALPGSMAPKPLSPK
jgi:hypothetical protein